MTLLNCVGASGGGGGGGGGGGLTPFKAISANYTVQVADLASGAIVLEVDASGGSVQIIASPILGTSSVTPLVTVVKIDPSVNAVNISDGMNIIDSIVTPASPVGQCDARNVRMNGTNLRVSVT